jgi:Tol biopolymer transport system component
MSASPYRRCLAVRQPQDSCRPQMPVANGTRLGRYEVRSLVGAGGMGEVYRAHDPKLNREVAVKVLPVSLAQDVERLRRFEQEAQAAGALNHPNILAIYDVEVGDGTPYVVSELLEGETLRDRLSAGAPLPTRKAIDYALQVARGLAAAHERGIIHRDLKPENIFITDDGHVKILDFGLAKLVEQTHAGEAQTDVPTRKVQTDSGRVMGTIGYMSPEQLRGQHVDARSDIFSFGAVLYEMLSGKRAFKGDSVADTISAILREDPPDLSITNKSISPAIERIVRHCLEKNPAHRFQSASDLAFDLESVSGTSGFNVEKAAAVAEESAKPAAHTRSRRRLVLALLIAGIALAALSSFVGYFAGRRAAVSPQPVFHQMTFRLGTVFSARFAPDGQTVVYGAAWDGKPVQLFTARPESPESRSLELPSADLFALSSTGEMALSLGTPTGVLFGSTGATLARAPLAGGAPREVVEGVEFADWSPDGSGLAVARRAGEIDRLEFPAGRVLYETTGYLSDVHISRKGDLIAFAEHPALSDNAGWVALVDLSGRERRLSNKFSVLGGLAWSPSGDEIWFTAADENEIFSLYAVTPSGQQRLVLNFEGRMVLQDVSRDGRVLVSHTNARGGILSLPPGETKERDLYWFDWSGVTDLSADGKTLLFNEGGKASGEDFLAYLRKTDGSPAVRLGTGYATSLSPDGKWVITNPIGSPAQLRLLPTGAGEPKPLTQDSIHHTHDGGNNFRGAHWLPDGQRFTFTGNEPGRAPRCYIQDVGGNNPRPLTPEGTTCGRVSPDGQTVVAIDAEKNVLLYPVNGEGAARPVPGLVAGDIPIRWSADGKSLYVYRFREMPAKVYRVDLSTGRKELWKELMPADPTGVINLGSILITPDAKSYAYTYARALSELYWIEGLK